MPFEPSPALVTGPRGRIFTAQLAPGKTFFYFEGHVDTVMFAPTMHVANECLKTGAAELYGDGENWRTYETGYRTAWTDWFLANAKNLTHTRLVVKSPILRMGVQVVNLLAKNPIEVLSTSEDLYRVIVEKVPRLRTVTASWPKDIAARALRFEPTSRTV